MAIEALLLEDFQAHARLELRLAPITVLVGDNGAGKSSVLRALSWLCLGRPGGAGVVRWGSRQARVQARLEGRVLGKQRSGGALCYRLSGEEFAAPGSGVPEPIAAALRVEAGINFQRQHDPPFLLSVSAGKAAEELNRIVDLELVDQALSLAGKKKREAETLRKSARERAEKWEGLAQELAWVGECKVELCELESEAVRIQRLSADAGHLRTRGGETARCFVRAQELRQVLEEGEPVLLIGKQSDESARKARELAGRILQAQEARELSRRRLPELPEQEQEAAARLRKQARQLFQLIREAERAEREQARLAQAVGQAEEELRQFEVCPRCGNIILP